MSLDLNFNFNLKDITLDKLYKEASKNNSTNLSYNQNVTTTTYGNGMNKYGGMSNNATETLDLSLDNSVENNNINLKSNLKNDNTKISNNVVNTTNNLNSNDLSSQSADSNSKIKNNNSTLSQENNSIINNERKDSFNENLGEKQIKTSDSDLKVKHENDSLNSLKSSSGNTSTSSISSNSNNNNLTNSNINSKNSDKEIFENNEIKFNKNNYDNIKTNSKVINTEIKNTFSNSSLEINSEDYINSLTKYGLRIDDINRVINNEITLESLMEEIQNDEDNTRRKEIMISSYLSQYGLNCSNMEELESEIKSKEEELRELVEKKSYEKDQKEIESLMKIIVRLKNGEALDGILSSEIVAWEYVDKNGEKCYVYEDPYINGGDGIIYKPLTFEEMFKDSSILNELKQVLTKDTLNNFFSKDTIDVYRWEETTQQRDFFEKFDEKYNNIGLEKKQLEEEINKLQEEILRYKYIKENIEEEIDYYFKNIEKYILKDDFYDKCQYSGKSLEKMNQIKKDYVSNVSSDLSGNLTDIYIDNEDDIVNVISCMINSKNGDGNVISGEDGVFRLISYESIFTNFELWISVMTENEKQIFNYIYNTEGAHSAYKYLEDISDGLDKRWVAKQTMIDQEFAKENPVLASLASVMVTPIEGIAAACGSIVSISQNEKIRKSGVYSAGNVWRGQVAQDISENYGEGWSMLYSTGMSMADTGVLIAANAATGGSATLVLGAALMGSRSYVSTLNDALDRGLSDGSAVALAFSAATVESFMESYSLGHLVNLEGKLGDGTLKLVNKIANKMPNETLANIATKSTYIAASAVSQGIAEGEEEFATEIVNFVVDDMISGELSSYNISIDNYINMGYSEEEARKLANLDFSKQLGLSFTGGFISGICFGSFSGVKTTHNVSKNIAKNIESDYNGNTAKAFVEEIKKSRIAQGNLEKMIEENRKRQIKEITDSLKKSILELSSESVTDSMKTLKKVSLGSVIIIPSVVNKMRIKPLVSNLGLVNEILQNGLLHITTEEAAHKIIDSGYVKASGLIASYLRPSAFFFSGIPSFANVCLNVNYLEKAVAVRIKPSIETLSDKNFGYRAFDDHAITYSGNFNFNSSNAEIVYLGLTLTENGEYEYKEITKTEYDNFISPVSNDANNTSKIINMLLNNLKTITFGLSYQYDIFVNNISNDINKLKNNLGYDYIVKPKGDLSTILEQIIKNNDGSKVLIELSNINELTLEMLEKVPANVNFRIIDYNMEFYQTFRKSRQNTVNAILEHLTYNVDEIKLIIQEFNNVKKGIDENWNDYQKAKYVYDYMVNNIEYQKPLSIIGRDKHFDGLMSLVDKVSTCSGFAHTYSAILNNIGINCSIIWGNMNGEGNHAYNIVSIDGNNFIVDTTRESINKSNPCEFEGTGFGVQNVGQYVAISNIDLFNNVNSTFDVISQNLVQQNNYTNEITGTESVEELHEKLTKIAESGQPISLDFLENKSAEEIYDYILKNISEINVLVQSKQIQEFIEKYYGEYPRPFTRTIINNLSSENTTQKIINQILEFNDEQFENFINTNTNINLYRDPQIFKRAMSTGMNFINKLMSITKKSKSFSDFTLEQILEYKQYNYICKQFFKLANDIDSLLVLKGILYDGGIGNYSICSKIHCKDNPTIEFIRRVSMAYLFINNPETFKALVENNINVFHGTNGNALPNIIKYGMNSFSEAQKKGITISTGENWSRIYDKRDFISFTDVLDIAEQYSSLRSTASNPELEFSVIIGTSTDKLSTFQTVRSDISEFGVGNHLDLDQIKCICVPSDKVEYVRKMLNNDQILVLGLSNLENKFYYYDFSTEFVHYDNDRFNNWIKKISN